VIARPRIEDRLSAAGLPGLPRLAWLEIDTDALEHNLSVVRRSLLGGTRVAAVIKADGYGHGIEVAGRAFARAGADLLCVATLDEAEALREVGVAPHTPILVLFPVPPEAAARVAAAGIELVASDEILLSHTLRAWRSNRRPGTTLRLHLEIETGLSRGGVRPAQAAAAGASIVGTAGVSLAGIWSHLASGDDPEATAAQVHRFEEAWTRIAPRTPAPSQRHLSATAGLLAGTVPSWEMVRPGLLLYGVIPEGFPVAPIAADLARSLRPAMALRARALRIEALEPGEAVSYGGRWRATRPSRIATLPIGYGDGWSRSMGGASVLIRGSRAPIVGSVAMDALMVDVTGIENVGPEEEFTLLGESSGVRIDVAELARLRTTISWEVLTSMARRVPRVYHAGSGVTGMRTLAGERRAG
jgi:alanine racemase